MAVTSGTKSTLNLLLESIINGQRDMTNKLDGAIAKMATKDDLQGISDRLSGAASVTELHALSSRVAVLEGNKLPKWFWPGLTTILFVVAAFVAPVLGAYATNYYSHILAPVRAGTR